MAMVKKGQTVEVLVETMAFGGKGIAKIDDFCVFIDQAVPGDRVAARIYRKKKNYAEARILEILEKSVFRVDPPCPYAGFCGGCKWQHVGYEHQLQFKRAQVEESLAHLGGISDARVLPTIPSAKVFGYRNKMEFTCADRRWLLPEELQDETIDKRFALGLHVPGTFNKVLDTRACLLQPDAGNDFLKFMRHRMKHSGLRPYHLKRHDGFWRFLMLRHSVHHDNWMINMITREENSRMMRELANELMSRFPHVAAVVNNITRSKAGVAVGEYEIPLAGETVIHDRIGDYHFEISANSFFQTNTRGAEVLYRKVLQYAELNENKTVLDLYCGTGTISIFLANRAHSVLGIEISDTAVLNARKNAQTNNVDNCRFVQGDIRQRLGEIRHVPDVVVIDPPRAGMHKDVLAQVGDMAPERIVYVSCNPATLARDLQQLQETYFVSEVQPVDMFPHTYHIESVAKLIKKTGAGRRDTPKAKEPD